MTNVADLLGTLQSHCLVFNPYNSRYHLTGICRTISRDRYGNTVLLLDLQGAVGEIVGYVKSKVDISGTYACFVCILTDSSC